MSHTGFTRVSLRAVAILVVLLAAVLLGPAPIKAALPVDQGDVYIFAPTGVTDGHEVRLSYHNLTKGQVKVRFVLLDAEGQDLFVVKKINGTFIVEPGTMATSVVPGIGIVGANQTRAEVTGAVALWVPPAAPQPVKPRLFLGPASLQIVDELTQETRLSVGIVHPSDLVGLVHPEDLVGVIRPDK